VTNAHLSDAQLYDLEDRHLSDDEREDIQAHLTRCQACRSRLEATRALLGDLAGVPTDAAVVPTVLRVAPAWTRARARRLDSPVPAVAAAILIFAVGLTVGARMRRATAPSPDVTPPSNAETVAEAIQESGTHYVTAIAALRRRPGSAADVAQGREVAVSALFGAAYELQRIDPADPGVRDALRCIEELRDRGLPAKPTIGQEQKP